MASKPLVEWSAGHLHGGTLALFGQRPDRPDVWVEIITGSSVRFIIRLMRDAGERGERLVKTRTTQMAQIDPEFDRMARTLGMPGAGYAMELGEKMLKSARRSRR